MRTLLLAATASLFAAGASAQSDDTQQQQQPAPPPSCEDEIHQAFDFWVGEWEVFTTQGAKAGENTISKEEYGCLLVERWVDNNGGTGQSYNFYDNAEKKWRQVWVSRGATIDYAGGLNDDGQMVFEGEIGYRNGTTAPFRGTWTPNEDGSVTQYFQQYNEETENWDDWFTGVYKPKQ